MNEIRESLPKVMHDAGETAEEAVRRLAAEVVGLRQQLAALPGTETEWSARFPDGTRVKLADQDAAAGFMAGAPSAALFQREVGPWVRAEAEARPHDDEETDAEREARFDAAALDVVVRVSGLHDDEDAELRADQHAELDPEAERALRLHLASMHANASAFTLPAADLDDVHRHDHFGPCGLRNHDFADRTYDEAKARAVVAELEDGNRG